MGHLDAMSVYSKKLLGIQSDVLEEIEVEPNLEVGWKILCEAGSLGDSYAYFLSARYINDSKLYPTCKNIC